LKKRNFEKKAMITRVTMVGNGRKPRRCDVCGKIKKKRNGKILAPGSHGRDEKGLMVNVKNRK
jgi:hypothetical protein